MQVYKLYVQGQNYTMKREGKKKGKIKPMHAKQCIYPPSPPLPSFPNIKRPELLKSVEVKVTTQFTVGLWTPSSACS